MLSDARQFLARNGMYRSRDEQLLGGVCAGLGRRLHLRPWPARGLFVLVLMLLPGSQLIVYPVLWVLLPVLPTPVVAQDGWGTSGQPAEQDLPTRP